MPFIKAVYRARLVNGQSLDEAVAVSELAKSFGLALFARDAREQQWIEHEANYLALGIHDSPAFVLGEEAFQGRQHYPLIEWRLRGESGRPPL